MAGIASTEKVRLLKQAEAFTSVYEAGESAQLLPSDGDRVERKAPEVPEAAREKAIVKIWKVISPLFDPQIEVDGPRAMLKVLGNPECSASFRKVTSLDLSKTGINCLPVEIFNLPLTSLTLNGLPLGYFPDELAKLQGLKTLLASDLFLKRVPVCLAQLPRLETLDLNHNIFPNGEREEEVRALKEDARLLADMPSLKDLHVESQLVEFVHVELAKSKALQRIWRKEREQIAGDAALQGDALVLHPALKNILALERPRPSQIRTFMLTCHEQRIRCFEKVLSLDLSNCKLTTIPSELRCMRQVQVIDLSKNQIKQVPVGVLSYFPELVTLNLQDNPKVFSGSEKESIQKALKANTKLTTIHFPEAQAAPGAAAAGAGAAGSQTVKSKACIVM